jgi:hypothetical protein
MAAYEHSTNDGVKLSVHARAKKQALGNLKSVMDSLSSPKIAHEGASAGVMVERKHSSPRPSEDFTSEHHTAKAEGMKPEHVDYAEESAIEDKGESPAHEMKEDAAEHAGGLEHRSMSDDGEVHKHASRANPGDTMHDRESPVADEHADLTSDPKKVDAALKKFLVKKKTHKY